MTEDGKYYLVEREGKEFVVCAANIMGRPFRGLYQVWHKQDFYRTVDEEPPRFQRALASSLRCKKWLKAATWGEEITLGT